MTDQPMKRALRRVANETWHYDARGNRLKGAPSGVCGDLTSVWGNLSDVWGNLSDVRGNLTGVWGNLSDVRGDLTGVRGNLSGVRGDLDECGLTDEDRERGVYVERLIGEGDD